MVVLFANKLSMLSPFNDQKNFNKTIKSRVKLIVLQIHHCYILLVYCNKID